MAKPIIKVVGGLRFTTIYSTALCKRCDQLVQAKMTNTNRGGYVVADRWECPCGEVLYDWHMDTSRAPAKPEGPKLPKGQLGLF